jgi:hypothetical protein
MAAQGEPSSEVYLELSSYARATVHALQNRAEGSGPVNWGVLAKDLKLTVRQLKALTRIHLPAYSNRVPLSSWMNLE